MTPLLAQRPRADRGFERLYQRHVGDVYRYALAVMRNQSDAEDVTQTTFLNAYRAFERGERPEKAQNWLIAIAHNVCRQRFRQSARRPAEVAFDDDLDGALAADDEHEGPTGEDIRRALGHLAFNQRAALVMRELEGRSYAEIAELLELSPSAVETLIFRARRALREQLESSLTCNEAELAISRQLDGRLDRRDRGALRAHLRECKACATIARRQRAQRVALRSLGAVPLPASLSSFFGGGGAVGGGVAVGGGALGGSLALKAAAALTAGAIVGSAGYEGIHHAVGSASRPKAAPSGSRAAAPASRGTALGVEVGASPGGFRRMPAGAPARLRGKSDVHAAARRTGHGSAAARSNGHGHSTGGAGAVRAHGPQGAPGRSKPRHLTSPPRNAHASSGHADGHAAGRGTRH
jgi:RNA polymerase sigma factor (sigma-70 family)